MTRDISKLAVDRVYYSPWCDEEGKVIDDGTVARLSDDTLPHHGRRPVLPLVRAERDRARRARSRTSAKPRPPSRCRAAVAARCSEAATGQDWTDVRYFGRRATQIAGVRVDVTRTGYTGDLRLRAVDAGRRRPSTVWDRALRGRRPTTGSGRRDQRPGRRARRGRPDPDRGRVHERPARRQPPSSSTPRSSSASGGWSTSRRPRTSSARRALLAEQAAGGPARRLVGLELDWAGIEAHVREARPGAEVSAPRCTATRCRSTARAARSGASTSSDWGPRSRRWWASAPWTQGLRGARHRGCRPSGASRASAARSPPPSCRCRSSTSQRKRS